ncbi:tail fiber protein [Escherichia phage vB_EcoP-101120B2]|nr:tail fiber protein [Escherichia phage vB_EcoP-101120B1-2]QZI79810.1 tail fiber protein [Escherichia phage vB_EcoP-101120B2]QZI84293.1 tail fiber protein [Escherichia phage vB_EcoP-PM129]QZI84354.1 tail fiber protein [Escherichia phage vB_EcoP-PM131]QZI84415.1 tail fiber protein [Escherichia phage vB_EcoP-PM137]QZI84476.1 tail fiber protein [Escherichia phage vB_EcoP-PM139]
MSLLRKNLYTPRWLFTKRVRSGGVRPDGIFFAEAAYQRRKLERIEARLSALEQK